MLQYIDFHIPFKTILPCIQYQNLQAFSLSSSIPGFLRNLYALLLIYSK